jgi:hypothetical protein
MSSELKNAKRHLRASKQSAGRTPESQIADVRKAVEEVIKHLEKLEPARE